MASCRCRCFRSSYSVSQSRVTLPSPPYTHGIRSDGEATLLHHRARCYMFCGMCVWRHCVSLFHIYLSLGCSVLGSSSNVLFLLVVSSSPIDNRQTLWSGCSVASGLVNLWHALLRFPCQVLPCLGSECVFAWDVIFALYCDFLWCVSVLVVLEVSMLCFA